MGIGGVSGLQVYQTSQQEGQLRQLAKQAGVDNEEDSAGSSQLQTDTVELSEKARELAGSPVKPPGGSLNEILDSYEQHVSNQS